MPADAINTPFLLCDGAVRTAGVIDHSPFTVGRSPDCDLVLSHPYVSRHHAAITLELDGYHIEDQGSRHGTFVSGNRVERHLLRAADTVHFGALDGPVLRLGERGGTTTGSAINEILGQLPAINASSSGLEKLRWFFESARKLNNYGAVDQILAVLLETTLQLTNVERGYVFLRDQSGDLRLALGSASDGQVLTDEASLSRSAMERASSTASEYIVTDTLSEEASVRSESIVAHNIRTVICIPLRKRRQAAGNTGETLGLLYLDSRLTPGNLTQVDSDLLRTIATEAAALIDNAQLAITEENERRYREELHIAAEIQQGLMAVKLPVLTYAAIWARSVPCKEVGGDFFDVVADGDSLSLVIADVSGKGISAAILASTLQGMIYAQLLAKQPLDRIAEVVNRYICTKSVSKYATLVILRLAPDGQMEYINCGHIAPLVCSSDSATRLTESNLPVGLICDANFTSAAICLAPHASILLATDGVTEAENHEGEFYGEERLQRSTRHCAALDDIYTEMQRFCGEVALNDDCTLVQVIYKG